MYSFTSKSKATAKKGRDSPDPLVIIQSLEAQIAALDSIISTLQNIAVEADCNSLLALTVQILIDGLYYERTIFVVLVTFAGV